MRRVRAVALNAEAIQDGNPQRSDEVSVRRTADTRLA